MDYNILNYKHKNVISENMKNLKDPDFKKQLILSAKKEYYTEYDLLLFYKHVRNIKLCVNKLNRAYKEKTKNSLKNSLIFLFQNYIESFINSVVSYYFTFTIDNDNKQIILNNIVYEIYNN